MLIINEDFFMKKFFLFFLLSITQVKASALYSTAEDFPDLQARSQELATQFPAVGRVIAWPDHADRSRYKAGTATIVRIKDKDGDDYPAILTAAHCITNFEIVAFEYLSELGEVRRFEYSTIENCYTYPLYLNYSIAGMYFDIGLILFNNLDWHFEEDRLLIGDGIYSAYTQLPYMDIQPIQYNDFSMIDGVLRMNIGYGKSAYYNEDFQGTYCTEKKYTKKASYALYKFQPFVFYSEIDKCEPLPKSHPLCLESLRERNQLLKDPLFFPPNFFAFMVAKNFFHLATQPQDINDSVELWGVVTPGDSGGPLVQDDKIIAVNSTQYSSFDFNQDANDFYSKILENYVNTYACIDKGIEKVLGINLRTKFREYIFNNKYFYASGTRSTAITEVIYQWMARTAKSHYDGVQVES